MNRTHVASLLLLVWIGALEGQAQSIAETPDGLVSAMEAAYERLDYATAERHAREALSGYERFSADQLVRVHTMLGLLLYVQNEPLEAREQFAAALTLDPTLTLDPVLFSPKTLEFFESVRGEIADGPLPGRAETVRYVRVRDPRPAATLRSLVVPGWGQVYKGERTKGWLLAGTWGALAVGTVGAHVVRSGARQDYLDATDVTVVADRYDTYNTWHRTRGVLALGTVAVWAYAAFDALAFGGSRSDAVTLSVSQQSVGLTVRLGR